MGVHEVIPELNENVFSLEQRLQNIRFSRENLRFLNHCRDVSSFYLT